MFFIREGKEQMMDTRKNFLIQWIRYIKFGLQYYILEKPRGLDFTMRD